MASVAASDILHVVLVRVATEGALWLISSYNKSTAFAKWKSAENKRINSKLKFDEKARNKANIEKAHTISSNNVQSEAKLCAINFKIELSKII